MIDIRVLAAVIVACTAAGPAAAQTADDLIAAGVRAYDNLDFDVAASLLRRGLASGPALDPPVRVRAFAYLAATEVFRGDSDSGSAVFGRLISLYPRHRIDQLVFPPEISSVFEAVRRTILAVAPVLPDSSTFRIGESGLKPWLYSSSFHEVRVELQGADGSMVRVLYAGLIGDSLRLDWDGRTDDGSIVDQGQYVLAVASRDETGTTVRMVRVPLVVEVDRRDSLPHPGALPDSLLLPERQTAGPGIEALVGGILLGAVVVALPAAPEQSGQLSKGRFAVGAAMSLAGIAGFFQKRPGREIAANISANDSIRQAWRMQVMQVERQNARSGVDITVHAGAPQVIGRQQ